MAGSSPAMTSGEWITMILIGQYNSPFVRRVAIAMRLYGIAFEHRPWSTFGDADKIAPYNPLRRVPTLVLDDGEALIESAMILDYLDDRVGPDKAMIARAARCGGGICGSARWRWASATRPSACCTSACCARRSSSISGSSAASRRSRACWRCWKRSALLSRRRTGSARASATPISRSPACCASPARRIRRCSTRAIRR